MVAADTDEETLKAAVLTDERSRHSGCATPRKVIVVAGRLVNLIICIVSAVPTVGEVIRGVVRACVTPREPAN